MIKGKLTGLRAVEKEDLALLRDWRNIDEFRVNFREMRELNMANQEAWFNAHVVNNPNNFMFIICDLKTGEPIGAGGLLYVNWVARYTDFSFYIGKDNLYIDDKGFAADAAETMLRYAYHTLNLNKVWMELYEFDTRKLAFFKGLGFKEDGKLRQNCFAKGKYWDSYIISLLANEFKS